MKTILLVIDDDLHSELKAEASAKGAFLYGYLIKILRARAKKS